MPNNTSSANNTNLYNGTITHQQSQAVTDFNKSNRSATTSLPTTSQTTKTKTGSSGSAGATISNIAAQSTALAGAYGNVVSKVEQMTGISLPNVTDIPIVGGMISMINAANDITSTLSSGEYAARTQADSTNPQAGAFKWVEKETTPMDFVSYDSVLLFAGEPIYADNAIGATFVPIGMCEQLNISTSLQINTLQELRCEEQIVLPGKSQPISINISRLCGKWSNLMNRLHNKTTDLEWCMSTQYKGMRDLFGLYGIVMDTSRRNIVHSFYIERCAIETYSFGISAGQMQIIESCTLRGGRIIDPNHVEEIPVSSDVLTLDTNVDTTLTIDGQEVNQEDLQSAYVLDADGNKRYEDGSYEDVNGNAHASDGSIAYKNGDIRDGDTYFSAECAEEYLNSKEGKAYAKAQEKLFDAQANTAAAQNSYDNAQKAYSDAIKSGADQNELSKLAKNMSKANEKVEKAKAKEKEADIKHTSSVAVYKTKVAEINKKNNVVELH